MCKIKDLKPGDIVKFDGYVCIVLGLKNTPYSGIVSNVRIVSGEFCGNHTTFDFYHEPYLTKLTGKKLKLAKTLFGNL